MRIDMCQLAGTTPFVGAKEMCVSGAHASGIAVGDALVWLILVFSNDALTFWKKIMLSFRTMRNSMEKQTSVGGRNFSAGSGDKQRNQTINFIRTQCHNFNIN